jgi:hypothetical protein
MQHGCRKVTRTHCLLLVPCCGVWLPLLLMLRTSEDLQTSQ